MVLSWCLNVMTIEVLYATEKQNRSTAVHYFMALHLLFVLYKGLMMDWFNSKHVTKPYEKEYKLCLER